MESWRQTEKWAAWHHFSDLEPFSPWSLRYLWRLSHQLLRCFVMVRIFGSNIVAYRKVHLIICQRWRDSSHSVPRLILCCWSFCSSSTSRHSCSPAGYSLPQCLWVQTARLSSVETIVDAACSCLIDFTNSDKMCWSCSYCSVARSGSSEMAGSALCNFHN